MLAVLTIYRRPVIKMIVCSSQIFLVKMNPKCGNAAWPIMQIFNILNAVFHHLSTQGLAMRQIRFRFDGQPINETDTPSQVRAATLLVMSKCERQNYFFGIINESELHIIFGQDFTFSVFLLRVQVFQESSSECCHSSCFKPVSQ